MSLDDEIIILENGNLLSFNDSDECSGINIDVEEEKEKEEDSPILIHLDQLKISTIDQVKPPLPTIKNVSNSISAPITTIAGIDHVWTTPEAKTFQVRSRSYLDDKIKIQSDDTIFQSRGVDFFMTKEIGGTNIGRHDGILGGNLRKKPTLIINFRFPWGVLVFYYEIQSKYVPLLRQKYSVDSLTEQQQDNEISYEEFIKKNNTPHDRAMYKFIMGDDTYRNSKLKLISRIVEGNIIVKKLVYGKPVIIGKKLPTSYFYEAANPPENKAEYWEIDLDVGSSSARIRKIVSVCKRCITALSVDMAFLIEGDCESELPERVLACSRIHHLDPELAEMIEY